MNLFCFSLEGSMDSLYEPVENIQETSRSIENRASSPPCTFTKMAPHERPYSMEKDLAASPILSLPRQDVELSDVNVTDANKMRKKSLIQKSISENEAFDRRVGVPTHYLTSRRPDSDCYLRRHCPIEDLSEEDYMMGDRTTLVTRMKAEENLCQEMDDSKSESMGTLKRLQKIVRNKKANDDVRHALLQSPTPDIEEEEEETLITCMKLTKSQEKKVVKETLRKRQEAEQSIEQNCATLDRPLNLKWNPSRSVVPSPDNHPHFFTDWKSFPDQFDPLTFSTSQTDEWEKCICCNHQTPFPCSFTDTDLPYAWVSHLTVSSCIPLFQSPNASKM